MTELMEALKVLLSSVVEVTFKTGGFEYSALLDYSKTEPKELVRRLNADVIRDIQAMIRKSVPIDLENVIDVGSVEFSTAMDKVTRLERQLARIQKELAEAKAEQDETNQ